MITFVVGYLLGVVSVAVWSDMRRKLTSAQERERAFQENFQGRGGGTHE